MVASKIILMWAFKILGCVVSFMFVNVNEK